MEFGDILSAVMTYSTISIIVVTVSGFVNLLSWILEAIDVVKAIGSKDNGKPILFMIGIIIALLGIAVALLTRVFWGYLAAAGFLSVSSLILFLFQKRKTKEVGIYALVLAGDIGAVILVRTLVFGNSLAGFLAIGSSLIALLISVTASGFRKNVVPYVLGERPEKKDILEPLWKYIRDMLGIKEA